MTADSIIQMKPYLSGKHKQSDEKDKERDRAHGFQVLENSWP